MADGTVLVLPIGEKFRIILGEFDPETLKYGTELIVPYTIEGAQGEVSVFALNKSVWFDVDLVEETANSGKLIIYQKDYSIEEYSDKIALFAVAEDGTTISKVISVVSNVLYPVSGNYGESFSIGAEGGQIAFTVATNREVEVETNADWITCVSTKAVEVKTLLFDVQSNEGKNRRATVEISSGDITLVFVVNQSSGDAPEVVEPITEGVIWENDGTVGAATWSDSPYLFSIEGGDPQGKCVAEIPAAVWAGMKIEPFYVNITPVPDVGQWQIRITDGWWSKNYSANDITPGYEGLTDNGDGTYTFQVDLASNPDLVAVIDAQHLLFTGSGFIINEIYFSMPDGGEEPETPEQPAETVIWENDGTFGEVTWNNTYSFALEGTNGGDASVDVPADLWQYFKSGPFHVVVLPVFDWWQIRVLTGWWSSQWPADDFYGEGDINVGWTDNVADNGDGTFTVTIDFTDHAILDRMDEQYLLFTGSGFQIQKIYSLQ